MLPRRYHPSCRFPLRHPVPEPRGCSGVERWNFVGMEGARRVDIMHVALGGCLKAPPVSFGLTEDTGGHIAYVLGAAAAQAKLPEVSNVRIVTRRFEDPRLGSAYAQSFESVAEKLEIVRLATAETAYLDKQALEAALPDFTRAFLDHLLDPVRRPHVIHAHFADAAEVALAARGRFGIPFVYTPHSLARDKSALQQGSVSAARLACERRAIAEADAIIVSSRDEAERQIETYGCHAGGRVRRIAPGTAGIPRAGATDAARSLLAPFLRDLEKPLILAIARPVRKKNLPRLVEAFATTPGLAECANLAILAGLRDGPHSGNPEQQGVVRALLDLLDRHDLYGRMALPRNHTPEAVAQLYRFAASTGGVFANPALFEPFGLTLIEAAAAGLPVVATHAGGPVDILAEIGHGTLIDPEDPAAIGSACRALITDRVAWTKASRAGRKGAQHHSWDIYARRSLSVYHGLTTSDRALRAPSARAAVRPHHLVVCDIDNTLTGCRLGARRFKAWAEERSAAYIVATGRSISEARGVLADWDLPEPEAYLTSVGSEIYRRDACGIPQLWRAYSAALDRGWHRAELDALITELGLAPQPAIEQRRHKLSYIGDAAAALAARLGIARAGLDARVVHSHGNLIDILPSGAGKANAVRTYAEAIGLGLDACIAAGDSGNDLDMLQACARAIVVANASTELDGLTLRPGLRRTRAGHANGVLEGLAWFGLVTRAGHGEKITELAS